MAGLGRKDFQAGAVLSAADVDGYLMDQTVMKFANTAAAGSAYGTAIAEGMNFYLSDTDEVVFHNGTTFAKQGGYGAAGVNKIINGAFDINQRNFTSVTATSTFTFDRWFSRTGGDGTGTFTPQTFTPGAAPVAGYEGTNYMRIVTSGSTSVDTLMCLRQNIEDVRTFAGQTVTISFWAKAASGTPKVSAPIGQLFGTGGSTGTVNVPSSAVTISTSWARYAINLSMPSVAGKTIGANSFLSLSLAVSVGSNFAADHNSIGIQNNTFEFWGVQVETGSVATPFSRAGGTLQGELAACQRYTQVFDGPLNFIILPQGFLGGTTSAETAVSLPVQMRVAPTSITVTGVQFYNVITAGAYTGGTYTLGNGTKSVANIRYTHGSSMGSVGQVGVFTPTTSSSSVILSSEL